ncbi:MAG TPA: ribonuclease D [Saprospiraceae bacterium]|nr:ribonuclease D [Saprospiraceae bacterium]
MVSEVQQFVLIEKEEDLALFYEKNHNVKWLSFDTEFVGEKRFYTLLCLIQVATENGFYFIDSLKVKNLEPFFKLIRDPKILKITHAGDNDYRLLYSVGGVVPKNVFDVQLAAGFIGYKYPISFRKISFAELGVNLSKGYTVADWESRPFSQKQLKYALDDVLYLHPLYEKIYQRLEEMNRVEWVREECAKWEDEKTYIDDPNKEVLRSNLVKSLKLHKQAFLMRLLAWRREQAKQKNYSKEMILPNKTITTVVKNINSGKAALRSNRIISQKFVNKYWDIFNELYQEPITEEEKAILRQIPTRLEENPKQEILMDMLFLMVKHKCLTKQISPTLVIQRAILKKMATDSSYMETSLERGWRKELLGEALLNWLRTRNEIDFEIEGGTCVMKMQGIYNPNGMKK